MSLRCPKIRFLAWKKIVVGRCNVKVGNIYIHFLPCRSIRLNCWNPPEFNSVFCVCRTAQFRFVSPGFVSGCMRLVVNVLYTKLSLFAQSTQTATRLPSLSASTVLRLCKTCHQQAIVSTMAWLVFQSKPRYNCRPVALGLCSHR